MTAAFSRQFIARWADMDFNGHMANTAYFNFAADLRFTFFQDCGFPASEFTRLQIGPVVFRDEVDYYREFRLLEPITVTLQLEALSDDGSRFKLRNEFFKDSGELAARVISTGAWLDLTARKLTVPPAGLASALQQLPRSESFSVIAKK
ncbi:thioesterase family protein [Permianibacter sp. IMCC34836]|uniref:acyl-CoA thioesterase n=1 Tax=Permianibacter fluminis TaxID=2738515 RepID=UPI001555A936|nr:acyl-CoA thioesterase [Permianibacter fluminis]NQD39066.1 thioesterase family protein [Permianibacter fluminis]